MAKLRGVFFDLDNTLIDTRAAQRAGLIAGWAAAFGAPLPPEMASLPAALRRVYESRFGHGTPGYAELAHISREELMHRLTADALSGFVRDEGTRLDLLVRAYLDAEQRALGMCPGAIETLDRLRAAGLRLGIITNGPSAVQRNKLAVLALTDRFDLVLIDTEFGHPKPDRRIFEHAAAGVGLSPAELLFIGDHVDLDTAGAQSAGWIGVWYNPRDEPLAPGLEAPDYTVRSLAELLTLPPF
jgi:putative hydrolase of the HAD superfamily